MRVLARISLTLAGLALLAPAASRAGMPVPSLAAMKTKKAVKSAPKKLCPSCQYRAAMAQGLRVPPPPPLPAGAPARGERCSQCGQPTAVVSTGAADPTRLAGRAVVGGAAPVGLAMPGEPMPIGVVGPRVAAAAPAAAAAGPRDPAVMPTSMASDPIRPAGANRPHVVSHLLGLSGIGRERAEARARRKEERHAMIPYGQQPNPVQDVPASVVYGRR